MNTINSRAATAGMCSKCYKEHVKRSAPEVESPKPPTELMLASPAPAAAEVTPSPVSVAAGVDDSKDSKKSKSQVDRTRCAECKKKVGLTGIECRCCQVYCGAHRIAEKHACTFDFKAFGRSNIEKANERVVAESLGEKL